MAFMHSHERFWIAGGGLTLLVRVSTVVVHTSFYLTISVAPCSHHPDSGCRHMELFANSVQKNDETAALAAALGAKGNCPGYFSQLPHHREFAAPRSFVSISILTARPLLGYFQCQCYLAGAYNQVSQTPSGLGTSKKSPS